MNLLILSTLSIFIILGSTITIQAQEDDNIPSWVKQTALWWGEGIITDSEFVSSIEYLVNNKIVKTTESKDERFIEKYKAWAKKEIKKYKDDSEQLRKDIENQWKKINNLEDENKKLKDEIKNQQSKYSDEYKYSTSLETGYDKLLDDYNLLVNDYNLLDENNVLDYNTLVDDYNKLDAYVTNEERKPKTTIINGEISWDFYDSKGNFYSWSMPIETYESYVKQPRYDYTFVETIDSGEKSTHVDFTPYVTGNVFNKVIDNIYENSKDDYDFLKEVWYITSNFSTYGPDIGEYPRFALETFSRGSGDCEDTSILLADMLRSSKYTKDWVIQLVYFDIDNPSKSSFSNHVAV